MQRLIMIPVILAIIATHSLLNSLVWENRAQIRESTSAGYVIPSRFSRILAMGNKGILSDFLFLKASTFFGGRSGEGAALSHDDWQYFIETLDVVTDLDPYFVDPYFLAEGLLAWDAGLPEEANKIILKGASYRTNDWRLPFFVGFNYFYFLNDHAAATDFIMKASRMPGSPDYFPTLAARLAYYSGKSMPALLFLRQVIEESDDPLLRKRLAKRLLALERAVIIEDAVAKYIEGEGRQPERMAELVEKGYLEKMPDDPYGGKWGILQNGRVFSTSKFVDLESD